MARQSEAPAHGTEPVDPDAAFVAAFADAWRAPSYERFRELMHPDVRLVHPIAEEVVGHEGFREFYEALFAFIPDLTATVRRWET